MSLPGINTPDEQAFPNRVVDSQSTLPYRASGTAVLAATNVPEDLVLVSALRRFENKASVAVGTHTGSGNAAVLTDSTADFLNWGVEIGDTVFNTTDGSSVVITDVTAVTITGVLTGGTDNDWDASDVYRVDKTLSHQGGRAETIRRFTVVTDLDIYLEIDGEAASGTHYAHVKAGEAFDSGGIRIVSRISIINTTGSETPQVRWAVWGL